MQFGAGQEEMVLGQNRGGAGRNADTGITALALLAFLGAGHSHVQGEYQDTVRRGLDFLLRSQAADGSLFGDATLYAQMYCHSMATFALAEAQAMTGDRRLEPAVTKAVNFQPGRAKHVDRRLAISARRHRRHQPTRLADHGPGQRRSGPASTCPTKLGIASIDFCAPSAAATTADWPVIGPIARPARR